MLLPIDHAVGGRGAISVSASTPDKAAPVSSCFGSTIFVAMSDDVVGCPETAAASGWFDGRAREAGERVLAAEIRRGGHGQAVIGPAYARGVGPTHSSTHPVNRWFGGGEVRAQAANTADDGDGYWDVQGYEHQRNEADEGNVIRHGPSTFLR
jgi:hypothetical protein